MSDAMKPLIYSASEGPLSKAQAKRAFEILFEGEATDAQIGGLLMAMRAGCSILLTQAIRMPRRSRRRKPWSSTQRL